MTMSPDVLAKVGELSIRHGRLLGEYLSNDGKIDAEEQQRLDAILAQIKAIQANGQANEKPNNSTAHVPKLDRADASPLPPLGGDMALPAGGVSADSTSATDDNQLQLLFEIKTLQDKLNEPRSYPGREADEKRLAEIQGKLQPVKNPTPPPGTKQPEKPAPTGGNHGTGKPPVKIGQEIELAAKEISKKTDYGELKLAVAVKVAPTYIGGGSDPASHPVGANVSKTSRIKKGERQGGVKQGFSYQDIEDREFWKFNFTNFSVGVEGEWSGSEISAYGQIKFDIENPLFTSRAEFRPVLFKVKEGESPKLVVAEIKISPVAKKATISNVETLFYFEAKGTFEWDKKKVGQKIVETIARRKLEKEAKKQGVKQVGKQVAKGILTKLAAVATAFEAGWVIGKLLNQFTSSDEAAEFVLEETLGSFKEQYHNASTVGKMVLIYANKEKIVAALILAGVVGVFAGIGDILLFKILKLDQLAQNFKLAFEIFQKLIKAIPNVGEAAGDAILSTAIKTHIKLNPKYRTIKDPFLNKLALAVFATLQPAFKKRGGINDFLSLRLHDVDVDEDTLGQIAERGLRNGWNYAGKLDLQQPAVQYRDDFLDFQMVELVKFLETNGLISYSIPIDENLSMNAIPDSLIDEVFK